MKKIIIPATIIASVGFIAPKFIGSSVNQDIESIITQINEQPGSKATLVHSDEGWFSSSSIINIGYDPEYFSSVGQSQLPDDNQKSMLEVFGNLNTDIEVNIQHGPVLTRNGFSIGLASWTLNIKSDVLREHIEYAQDKNLYSMIGKVGLNGSINFEDEMPTFNYVDTELGINLNYSGWQGEGSLSSNYSHYKGKIEQLSGMASFLDINVKGISLESTLKQNWLDIFTNPLYDSDGVFSIASIDTTSTSTQGKTSAINLSVEATTDKNDDGSLMDMSISYKLDSFSAQDLELKDLLLTTDVNNVEKSFMKAYQEVTQNPANSIEAMQSLMKNELITQLKADPEINISALSGKINDGEFDGKILTKLVGINNIPDTLEDPKFWLSHVIAEANLSIDKSVVLWSAEQTVLRQLKANPDTALMSQEEMQNIASQQAQAVVDSFVQQGILTETAEGYKTVFNMKDGQAQLNGNPMPLPL